MTITTIALIAVIALLLIIIGVLVALAVWAIKTVASVIRGVDHTVSSIVSPTVRTLENVEEGVGDIFRAVATRIVNGPANKHDKKAA